MQYKLNEVLAFFLESHAKRNSMIHVLFDYLMEVLQEFLSFSSLACNHDVLLQNSPNGHANFLIKIGSSWQHHHGHRYNLQQRWPQCYQHRRKIERQFLSPWFPGHLGVPSCLRQIANNKSYQNVRGWRLHLFCDASRLCDRSWQHENLEGEKPISQITINT